MKIPLFTVPGTFAVGSYTFPFSFQLPVGLPGSMAIAHGTLSASVVCVAAPSPCCLPDSDVDTLPLMHRTARRVAPHMSCCRYKVKAELHQIGLAKSNVKYTAIIFLNERLMRDVTSRVRVLQCCLWRRRGWSRYFTVLWAVCRRWRRRRVCVSCAASTRATCGCGLCLTRTHMSLARRRT